MTLADKNRDFQEIKRAALQQNWTVDRTKGNNYMFKSPDQKTSVAAGGNYQGKHALQNLVARLRQGGFVPPKKMR